MGELIENQRVESMDYFDLVLDLEVTTSTYKVYEEYEDGTECEDPMFFNEYEEANNYFDNFITYYKG